MAKQKIAKRKTATKKLAKIARSPVLKTKDQLLDYLMAQWIERDPNDPLIAQAQKVLTTPNPLENPPAFLPKQSIPLKVQSSIYENYDVVHFGEVNGYSVEMRSMKNRPRRAVFKWGCATEYSEVSARDHWYGNVSIQSGNERPHATELLDYAAAVCKHLGWEW
jgi:hypothetical protein